MSLIGQLFPKARAEVIRLLFTDPDRSLHLRELARLSGLAVGTIQTEAAKLPKAGLLEERRDGIACISVLTCDTPYLLS